MKIVDESTLSQYLDGTLEYQCVCETADQIARDPKTCEMMLELLRTHALLKALGNETIAEDVPARMLESFQSKAVKKWNANFLKRPFLQVAATIALIVVGFASGRVAKSDAYTAVTIFPGIPVALEKTVNTVLENEKSGIAHSWSDITGRVSAKVTPIKTYRDGKGSFYRIYFIELSRGKSNRQLAGVAHRIGKDNWQTQSVFSRDHIDEI